MERRRWGEVRTFKYDDAGRLHPDPQGDVLCPQCGRVLVLVSEYDATNETRPLPGYDFQGHLAAGDAYDIFWGLGLLWSLLTWPLCWLKGRRLRRNLQRYPGSLICPNCGFLAKRLMQ